MREYSEEMKMPAPIRRISLLGAALTFANAIPALADDGGPAGGPHIHEESHGLEGLPILLIICSLIIAIGLAYGIGRRSRK
jgi:hypothetical protein